MKAIVLYLFFAQFLLNSCVPSNCAKSGSSVNTQGNDRSRVTEVAKEKYGEIFTVQENETKEFYLVSSRSKSSTETAIKFFIFEKENQMIIHEDVITLGSVKWDGRYRVNVQKFPGTVRLNDNDNNKSGYLYDVKTKQKIKE